MASDSRQTIDGKFCDGAEKFIEPAKPDRLLLAVTGRRGYYSSNLILSSRDICGDIKRNSREIDFGEIARGHIEMEGGDLASLDLVAFSTRCIDDIDAYFRGHPERLPLASRDFFSSTFVMGSYAPETQTATVRSFTISVSPDGKSLSAMSGLNEQYTPNDTAEPMIVGEREYLMEHVLPIIRSEPVGTVTRAQLANFPTVAFPKVNDLQVQDAAEVAVDLIEAASRMTERKPAKSGIGGPVDVRLVGKQPRPLRMR